MMNNKSLFSIFAAILFILILSLPAYAAAEYGVTRGTGIQVRNRAVNGEIVKRLNSGIRLKIEDESEEKDGAVWYRVSSASLSINGFVRSDFLMKGAKGPEDIEEGSTYKTVVDDAKIKSEPGNNAETLCTLSLGTLCTVKSTVFDEKSGYYWFLVTFEAVNGITSGYIRYDCLNIDDYNSGLIGEGFPDSYTGFLSNIHAMYPNWEFKAYNPAEDMTFDECVDEEAKISVVEGLGFSTAAVDKESVILKGTEDIETSLNSFGTGEFSFPTGDRNDMQLFWKAATRKQVAYYMDPRNFMLTSEGELNPSFLMFLSGTDTAGTSLEGVEKILSTSSMTGTIPGEGVTYAETVYSSSTGKSMNPYLIAARMVQEHGNAAGDPLINGNYSGYEGYYNYFNIQAYEKDGKSAVENGLRYAKEQGWNTRVKSINGGIKHLEDNYFFSSKHKQDTLYKQRFFFKDGTYCHQYMTSLYAPHYEAKKVFKGYGEKKSSDSAGVFLIPVYKDMPDSPASPE